MSAQDILATLKNGHADPIADQHYEDAAREIERLRGLLKLADESINPKDRGGISLETWNLRLKAATAEIRSALAAPTIDSVLSTGRE